MSAKSFSLCPSRYKSSSRRYAFDFSRAARYIDLAHENGIRRFEIAHLYSQWGMTSAPNIYVRVDGREEHLFGWHTPAQSEAYQAF